MLLHYGSALYVGVADAKLLSMQLAKSLRSSLVNLTAKPFEGSLFIVLLGRFFFPVKNALPYMVGFLSAKNTLVYMVVFFND